jgi:hypothetical protein
MAWITTKDGRKVNTDWFDQERQIAESKKEADERNDTTPINEIAKDGSLTMTYVHIHNNTQKIKGMDFGQDIEPAGEYMSMDTMRGKSKIDLPNYEYGTIHFKKPLIIEHKNTSSKGWKKDLSERYGGKTKKALSNAIKKDGYDAVITYEIYKGKKEYVEIVNLGGEKRK